MAARHARIGVRGGSRELLERAGAEAFEAGALGVEERAGAPPALWVYALVEDAARVCEALRSVPGLELGAAELLAERAWSEAWKEGLEPIVISPRLLVRPSFRAAPAGFAGRELVIDPGQAFGTGTHPTTRLCLELLLDIEPNGSFADLGCGSGVLAIAAAKLGFAPVTALDSDREAVEAAVRNARDNGVALDRVERYDLRRAAPPPAQTVAANLMRPLLLQVAQLIEPPNTLILSGLLDHEADEVAAAFAPLTERRRLSLKGWTALLLERAASPPA